MGRPAGKPFRRSRAESEGAFCLYLYVPILVYLYYRPCHPSALVTVFIVIDTQSVGGKKLEFTFLLPLQPALFLFRIRHQRSSFGLVLSLAAIRYLPVGTVIQTQATSLYYGPSLAFRVRPVSVNHITRPWLKYRRANNRAGRRPTELKNLVAATNKVSEPSAILRGNYRIFTVVSKAPKHNIGIIASTWVADNVTDGGRHVEDVLQMKRTVSSGARALREQLDWEVNVANTESFQRARYNV